MSIGRPGEQRQESGNGSTSLQAGRDIHHYGLTLEEARSVALDVFRSNAIELAGVAQAVAVSRAEQLTNDFLSKLEHEMPERASALADPDMQNALFQAQTGFARSGEEDLLRALVELLAERSGEGTRSLRTLALNEAIASAPKLTEGQRKAIAWVFYLRYTRMVGVADPNMYYVRLAADTAALGTDVPSERAHYQHIEYVGAGSISLGSVSFGEVVRSGIEGLFTRGFTETDVDPELLEILRSKEFIIPATRDKSRLQLQLVADEELEWSMNALGLDDRVEAVKPLLQVGRLADTEVADEVTGHVPALGPLRKLWDDANSSIGSLTLTSVGIAIGHSYWTRATGIPSRLEIWLP